MVNDPEILLVPELLAKPSRRAVLASAGSGLILLGGTGFGFAQGAFGGYDDDRLYKDQDGNLYRKRGGQYVRYNGRVANGRPVPGSETPDGFGGRPAQETDLDAEAYARRRAERYGEPPPASAAGPNPTGPSGPRQAGVQVPVQAPDNGPIDHATAYSALTNEPFPVAAINTKKLNPAFLRQEVAYTGAEPPGTIVVDPKAHQLYFVLPGGRARRYGVGVGKQGFAWAGAATINSKQAWPDWYPPKEMIERRPDLRSEVSKLQSGLGVPGGARNPLGARAMYLWQNNKDTLFRIHGTLEPYSIGQSVSSGCIRMINQDAIDLYNRVDVGTKVVVIGDGPPAFQAGPSGRAAARIASRR